MSVGVCACVCVCVYTYMSLLTNYGLFLRDVDFGYEDVTSTVRQWGSTTSNWNEVHLSSINHMNTKIISQHHQPAFTKVSLELPQNIRGIGMHENLLLHRELNKFVHIFHNIFIIQQSLHFRQHGRPLCSSKERRHCHPYTLKAISVHSVLACGSPVVERASRIF